MTSSNFVYEKGTIFVAPGGGSAPVVLLPGIDGTTLTARADSPLGVDWEATGNGTVGGPGSSTAHNFASFADTSGALLEDSGVSAADFALSAGSSTSGHLASFSDTIGTQLADSGIVAALVALGVAGPVVDNAIPRFDGTGGKQLQSSTVLMDDTGNQTFPTNTGVKYTAGSTKGSFTFSSGTHAKITTSAAVTGALIVYTIVTLGTVTVAQAILTTIDTGVGFTPVSADATDTSVVNWAIVA